MDVPRENRKRLYFVWRKMVARCCNPSDPAYPNYGGRGITICGAWRDSYDTFLDDMYPSYQPGLEIDRRDNGGNYEPGNCRWATHQENQSNTRKSRHITRGDETHTLREWARRTGVHHHTIARRLDAGQTAEEALTPTQRRTIVPR